MSTRPQRPSKEDLPAGSASAAHKGDAALPSAPSQPKALAIFGGTFDPVHQGHLACAQAVAALDKQMLVLLTPASQPPHRPQPAAPAESRLAMLKLAVSGKPRMQVDGRELHRPGPSYSYDTLKSFRCDYGASLPLLFVMGLDAYKTLTTWRHWQQLTAFAHLLILARPGQTNSLPAALSAWQEPRLAADPQQLLSQPAGRVCHLELAQVPVSSTQVRQAYQQGADVSQLVPAAVDLYIRRQGLYLQPQTQAQTQTQT